MEKDMAQLRENLLKAQREAQQMKKINKKAKRSNRSEKDQKEVLL